jgi:acyl-CoA reductase-like NAD-dependent aldehyde dehydrogenase
MPSRSATPFDPDTDLGPLANKRSVERTERMLAKAIEQGAVVAACGTRPDGARER